MVTAVRAVTYHASFHLLCGSDVQSDSSGADPASDSTVADSSSRLKLLMFCHSLADTDLTAANLTTRQHQLSVVTMLLGPVGLIMKILIRCDAP